MQSQFGYTAIVLIPLLQTGERYGDESHMSKLLSQPLQLLTATFWFGSRASGQRAAPNKQKRVNMPWLDSDIQTQIYTWEWLCCRGALPHSSIIGCRAPTYFLSGIEPAASQCQTLHSYNISWIHYPWFFPIPPSAWHVLNSVHFAKVNNVRELDFSCWGYIGFCVQFGQVHLGWQYNPPSEILRYRLHGYKLSSQVYGWRLKVSDSLRDVV